MGAVIEARELKRTYRTSTGVVRRHPLEVDAVRGISFGVGEGELFGLLGPNGADKTTTIKMLITLLLPTGGEARVHGLDVVRDAREPGRRRCSAPAARCSGIAGRERSSFSSRRRRPSSSCCSRSRSPPR